MPVRHRSALIAALAAICAVLGLSTAADAAPAADHFRSAAQVPVVTSISTAASNLGGTVVTIHGHHLSTASGALFGSVPGTNFHALSDSTVQVTAPAHTVGTLDVRVESATGMSPQTANDHVTYIVGSAMPSWKQPATVDATHLAQMNVSCSSSSFCGAVELDSVMVFSGGHWSEPSRTPVPLRYADISCPTDGRCYAVGESGTGSATTLASYADGRWTYSTHDGDSGPWWTISCGSADECTALDDAGDEATVHLGQWTPFVERRQWLGVPATPVACWAAGECRAFGPNSLWSLSEGKWTDITSAGYPELSTAAECLSSSFCVTVQPTGLYVYDGSTWSSQMDEPLPFEPSTAHVSCSSTTNCLADTRRGPETGPEVFWHWNGTTWSRQSAPTSGFIYGLSCVRGGMCTASGDGVTAMWDGVAWTSVTRVDYSHGSPANLACSSESFCALTDRYGSVSVLQSGHWSAPRPASTDPGPIDEAISCPADGACFTTTAQYTHGGWSPLVIPAHESADPYVSIGCVSSSWCLSITALGYFSIWDGTTWTAPESSGSRFPVRQQALDCIAVDQCFGLTANGTLRRYDGQAWTTAGVIPLDHSMAATGAVSCVDATFCVVAAQAGLYTWMNGRWTAFRHPYPGTVACRGRNDCVAGGERSLHWDGAAWTSLSGHTAYSVNALSGNYVALIEFSSVAFLS